MVRAHLVAFAALALGIVVVFFAVLADGLAPSLALLLGVLLIADGLLRVAVLTTRH
jgi:hypothetical protein